MTVSKKAVAAALAAAIGAGAVVPAAQAATTSTTTTRTSVYHIGVNDGILAGGGNVVRAKVVVKNPDPTVRSWYSRATIKKVVRKGVNNQIQKTYRSQGYRCVPVLDGSMNASTAHFTCKLRGADVPTTVTVTYTAAFMQNAG
jgi:uncharacterized membrane protein